jgi:hypothetical protein
MRRGNEQYAPPGECSGKRGGRISKPTGNKSKAKGRKIKAQGRKIKRFSFRESILFNGLGAKSGSRGYLASPNFLQGTEVT